MVGRARGAAWGLAVPLFIVLSDAKQRLINVAESFHIHASSMRTCWAFWHRSQRWQQWQGATMAGQLQARRPPRNGRWLALNWKSRGERLNSVETTPFVPRKPQLLLWDLSCYHIITEFWGGRPSWSHHQDEATRETLAKWRVSGTRAREGAVDSWIKAYYSL